jgi:hypothetical protein
MSPRKEVFSWEIYPPRTSTDRHGTAKIFTNMKKVQLILSVGLCVFGGVLLIAGFCCPPLGEIHPTILTAFGEILTFSGALLGLDYKYRSKKE